MGALSEILDYKVLFRSAPPARAWREKRPICLPEVGAEHHPLRTALAVPVPAGPQPLGVRLRQVFDELLANALTWAADGTPVELRLTCGEQTTVSVSNTGVPIRADERDRLFDLFYRGDDARHRGIPGAGLGLSLARAVVEQHGGTITISALGDPATTFTVRLPTRRPCPPRG